MQEEQRVSLSMRWNAELSCLELRKSQYIVPDTVMQVCWCRWGFSPIEIAKRLGHGKVTTTIETYCHQSRDAQEKITDRLGKVDRGEEDGV